MKVLKDLLSLNLDVEIAILQFRNRHLSSAQNPRTWT
jgi:hypothetical protein